VSVGGILAVVGVECSKLAGQLKVRILLAVCLLGPFAFAVAMVVQSSLPVDTLFGRAVQETGFAIALVVLGFAALWAFPMITSVVGGDLFSAEDRYGTWSTILTRSRSRAELFAGKLLTALSFSLLAVVLLAVSSVAAGLIVVGPAPFVDLTGALVAPADAFTRVTLAWATVLPPALGFTALAVLVSVATRSSAAGIGLPVLIGLAMQLYAFIDGPEAIRRSLLTDAFGSWHGLLSVPTYYTPLGYGLVVSVVYFVVCAAIAYRLLRRRDIGG
jgi:ABC-2 type transport system permease protein